MELPASLQNVQPESFERDGVVVTAPGKWGRFSAQLVEDRRESRKALDLHTGDIRWRFQRGTALLAYQILDTQTDARWDVSCEGDDPFDSDEQCLSMDPPKVSCTVMSPDGETSWLTLERPACDGIEGGTLRGRLQRRGLAWDVEPVIATAGMGSLHRGYVIGGEQAVAAVRGQDGQLWMREELADAQGEAVAVAYALWTLHR